MRLLRTYRYRGRKFSGGILTYIREDGDPKKFGDYLKVHLDTDVFTNGILGCFRVDDCACHYVSRGKITK